MGRAEAYQPYLISNFRTGYDFEVEPWLLPRDAFKKLYNAHLYRGILSKRRGYTGFCRQAHLSKNEAYATGNGSTKTYAHTAAHIPLRVESLTVTGPGGGAEIFTDDGDGTLAGSQGGSGTVNHSTGEISVTFNAAPSGAITCQYYWFPDLPIVGLYDYYDTSGSAYPLFFDTRRVTKYDSSNCITLDLTNGADAFTGADSNLFWLENWNDKAYFTNFKDRPMQYDGFAVSNLLIDTNGDGVNDVTQALLIFAMKNRLLLLRTWEGGYHFPQRARWGKPGTADFSNNEYVDAPTVDWIIAAEFLKEKLLVYFERSVWELRYTADYDLPFEWIKVVDTEGTYSTFSVGVFANDHIAVGPTSIIACDGLDVVPIDKLIPDLVTTFAPDKIARAYATSVDDLRQNWIAYVPAGKELCSEVLVMNYVDKSWSVYGLPFQCYGPSFNELDPTWDDVEETWDEIEYAWSDKTLQAGYPTVLGGAHDGWICRCNYGGSDNGTPIPLDIRSGRWNPYTEEGLTARLGYIDFLVTADAGISATVNLFIDGDYSAPAMAQTLECSGNGEMVWKRLFFDGMTANFHEIQITHDAAGQTLALHAVCPWFKRGGRVTN